MFWFCDVSSLQHYTKWDFSLPLSSFWSSDGRRRVRQESSWPIVDKSDALRKYIVLIVVLEISKISLAMVLLRLVESLLRRSLWHRFLEMSKSSVLISFEPIKMLQVYRVLGS